LWIGLLETVSSCLNKILIVMVAIYERIQHNNSKWCFTP